MINSVLLIRPRAVGKVEFPFGLLYVGTALKNQGFKIEIIDLQLTPEKEEYIFNRIRNSRGELILGISALAPHYKWVKEYTLKLKQLKPDQPIVIGGHIAIIYEQLLRNTGVDFVCLGEGERAMLELIAALNEKKDLKDINGMAYKQENEIIKTRPRMPLKEFLLPDYDLIKMEDYLFHPSKDMFFNNSSQYKARAEKEDKLAVIMFSRGCIGGCRFCYRHLPGFHQASVDWSWKHLMLLYEKYHVRYFRIGGELFTNDPVWLESFFKKVKDSKIDILFRVTGLRTDIVDDNQLELLKQMGCIAVNYGVESGSQTILDNMNKRTTVSQNLSAIKMALEHGMQVMAYIMVGYKGENRKTLNETANLIFKSGLSSKYISLFYTVPLPGTKLYHDCLKEGLIKDEEKYLIDLAPYIEEKKRLDEYYLINISDTNISVLKKWERSLPFLINLNKKLKDHPIIFNFLKNIVWRVPIDNKLFKIILKFYRNFKLF